VRKRYSTERISNFVIRKEPAQSKRRSSESTSKSDVPLSPIQQALEHAEEAKLDLVEVSPNEEPPVCKILDAKKEAYNQSKKARDSRKKSRNVRLKEIRLSCRISDNDLDLKLKKALEFLQQGDRVKFNLRFKGREIMHGDLGRAVMVKVKETLSPYATTESDIQKEGRALNMVMFPVTTK
jgi:translation initiation factor IF-3